MVATYDSVPAMSAEAMTEVAQAALEKRIYSLVVLNYANPDMVGHTGQIPATIAAIETVDRCVGTLLASIAKVGGTAIITADHGNAEYMLDQQGQPWTAHTTNPVPLILVEGEGARIPGYGTDVNLRNDGKLSDIAPTILQILQLPQPAEMTGRSLLEPSEYDVQFTRTPASVGM